MNNSPNNDATTSTGETNGHGKRGIKLAEKEFSRTRLGTAVVVWLKE